MVEQNFTFPSTILTSNFGLDFNPENPYDNIITIGKIDYIPNYFYENGTGNKGSNLILKLFTAQDWDEDIGYPEVPDVILKICKTPLQKFEKARSVRFGDEIDALEACNKLDPLNTIQVYNFGVIKIYNKEGWFHKYRYYTMEYASGDLGSYLTQNNPSLLERVNLFLEICDSLKLLWRAGYYHRDIKPDNILFFQNKWKIGDLGLVDHRSNNLNTDESGEWIGPRGWQSPESLNKFVTEKQPWSYRFDCKIDHQSDLYQLGKLLWFITQGNCPEGGIDRNDFLLKDDRLYQIVKTLLNTNKKRRIKNIDELIVQVKMVYNIYYKSNPTFSLH